MITIQNKQMHLEQLIEIRHRPMGKILDVRGIVADKIFEAGVFQHWNIDANVIKFGDTEGAEIRKDGAFVGYKNYGYVVINVDTKNYMYDRSLKFCKALSQIEEYVLPTPLRCGLRSKVFVPLAEEFEEIKRKMTEKSFVPKVCSDVGINVIDVQLTLKSNIEGITVQSIIGPLHRNEASGHFQDDNDEFKKTGLYFDIDCSIDDQKRLSNVGNCIRLNVDAFNAQIERLVRYYGE